MAVEAGLRAEFGGHAQLPLEATGREEARAIEIAGGIGASGDISRVGREKNGIGGEREEKKNTERPRRSRGSEGRGGSGIWHWRSRSVIGKLPVRNLEDKRPHRAPDDGAYYVQLALYST